MVFNKEFDMRSAIGAAVIAAIIAFTGFVSPISAARPTAVRSTVLFRHISSSRKVSNPCGVIGSWPSEVWPDGEAVATSPVASVVGEIEYVAGCLDAVARGCEDLPDLVAVGVRRRIGNQAGSL